jgi:hypothetical protein
MHWDEVFFTAVMILSFLGGVVFCLLATHEQHAKVPDDPGARQHEVK